MTLEQITSFVVLEREGNFYKAAEVLYIPQSTLSNRIRQLEQELGVSLFIRNKRRLQLTAAGQQFYALAVKMLQDLDEFRKTACSLNQRYRNVVQIGFPIAFYSEVVHELIPSMVAKFPDIRFSFKQMAANEIISSLKDNSIQLGLTPYKLYAGNIEYRLLNQQSIMALVPPGHPFASKTNLAMEEIRTQPIVIFHAGSLYQDSLIEFFHKTNWSFNVLAELNNLDAIKLLVKKNLGITLLPNLFARTEISRGELVSIPLIDSPFSPYTTYLAYKPEHGMEDEFLQNLIQELSAFFDAGSKTS